MSLSVIVLAAGKGTRMNSSKAKVFHEIANYPMIYHLIDTVKKLKPNSCSVIISDQMKLEKSLIKEKYNSLNFCIQKLQLGTADAVKSVKIKNNKKEDITLIVFADSPLIEFKTLNILIKKIKNSKSDLILLSMIPENPKNYGRIILKNNNVQKIVEFSEASKSEREIRLCNSGIMVIKTNVLQENLLKIKNNNSKKEYYLTDLVEILRSKNKSILHYECDFNQTLGVNDRQDLVRVDKLFQKRIREKFLKKGITILDPASTYFSYDTDIGKDSVIYPNVYFGLNVKIGRNVKIKSFSHIEDTQIKDNCEVGPFARIRDETQVSDGSRIGNFVEIKKSKIEKGVKIAHLSYIGDSKIGKNTNVGAGTITCNYDGKRKNKTIIGENCFIGSNTSLIAPLEIEKDSIVGAGAVIKRDVSRGTTVFRKSELIKKKNIKE